MENAQHLQTHKPSSQKASSTTLTVARQRMLPLASGGKSLDVPHKVTMQDALDGATIAVLVRSYGEVPVFNTLLLALATTVDSLSCQQPVGSQWIKIFITDWMEMYPYETVEDMLYFLKRVRQGAFGPLYAGRIDGLRLFEFFDQHMSEKADLREQQIREEQKSARLASERVLLPLASEAAAQRLKSIKESLIANQRPDTTTLQPEPAAAISAQQERINKGLADVALAERADHLLSLMVSFPYEAVQLAIAARATELDIQLPTRAEMIQRTKSRSRNAQ